MRISDWSSDVCSSDLFGRGLARQHVDGNLLADAIDRAIGEAADRGAVGGDVGRDEEDLVLLDPIVSSAGEHRARRGATGVECEAVVADHRHAARGGEVDRKSTRLTSSHYCAARMPSSACTKKNS